MIFRLGPLIFPLCSAAETLWSRLCPPHGAVNGSQWHYLPSPPPFYVALVHLHKSTQTGIERVNNWRTLNPEILKWSGVSVPPIVVKSEIVPQSIRAPGRGQCPDVTSDLSDDNVKAKTLSALSCHSRDWNWSWHVTLRGYDELHSLIAGYKIF